MPNRYGEPPEPDEPDNEPDNPPPTTDHKAAAQHGINLIYATMGWKPPQNRPQDQPDTNNQTP